jgi:hypothetical protein
MSIVLLGSTSGSCTLQEQAVAGTSVLTLPVGTGTVVANNVNSAIVSGTSVTAATGSPTSIDFTSIPSWVKRITVMFSGVSTNGTANIQIQLGDAGGIEATGYLTASSRFQDAAAVVTTNPTTGFGIITIASGALVNGLINISLLNSSTNLWSASGTFGRSDTAQSLIVSGSKSLSDVLTQVRITANGTDTFDAGTINILYE